MVGKNSPILMEMSVRQVAKHELWAMENLLNQNLIEILQTQVRSTK